MALKIVVSCCSVPSCTSINRVETKKKYVRGVVRLYTGVILQELSCIIGLPVVLANKFIYCLADAKLAFVACSQLLVVTNKLNPASCLV